MAAWKFTFHFGFKKWGWNENIFWDFSSTDLATAKAFARTLATARKRFLVNMFDLEGVSMSRLDDQGRSLPIGVNEIQYVNAGAGPGTVPVAANCASLWQALYVRMYDSQSFYASNLHFRGVVPQELRCAITPGSVPAEYDTVSGLGLKNFLLLITGQNDGVIGRCGFFARSKIIGRAATVPIDDAKITDDGYLSIKPRTGVFTKGQQIHLHGFNGPGSIGLDGDCRIRSGPGTVAPDVGFYVTTARQGPTCVFTYLEGAVLWRVQKIFVPYDHFAVSRTTNRKTGVTMFGTRGTNQSSNKQR